MQCFPHRFGLRSVTHRRTDLSGYTQADLDKVALRVNLEILRFFLDAEHGAFWFPYFVAFAAALTAMRVLIAWVYANRKSLLLAQFMHMSSTGSLVIFSPARVTAAQETLWYSVYAAALWLVVVVVVVRWGKCLTRDSADEEISIGPAAR